MGCCLRLGLSCIQVRYCFKFPSSSCCCCCCGAALSLWDWLNGLYYGGCPEGSVFCPPPFSLFWKRSANSSSWWREKMLGTGQIRGPCWRAGWVSARALFTHVQSWCGHPSISSWRICIFCDHSNSLGTRACFLGFVWFFPLFFSLVVLFFGYTSIGSPVQWDLSFGECWGSRWPPPARGFWGSGCYVAWCYVPLFYTYMHIYRDVWNWLVFSIIVYPKLRNFFLLCHVCRLFAFLLG